jgi:PAS domain-containing protein
MVDPDQDRIGRATRMNDSTTLETILEETDTPAIGRMLAGLSDIAIVVGEDDVVLDVPHVRQPAEALEPAGWRGRGFGETVAGPSVPGARDFLARLRRGRSAAGESIVHAAPSDGFIVVRYGAAALTGGGEILLLGQVKHADEIEFGTIFAAGAKEHTEPGHRALADVLRHGSDLVVLLDASARLLWANDAFLAAAQVSLVTGPEGRFLEDLVTWHEKQDLGSLMAEADRSGRAGPASASLRSDAGESINVTVGVTRLPGSEPAVFGAVLRPAEDGRASIAALAAPEIASMINEAGQVPLKGIVRETTDVVEKLCLQAALRLTDNNRSAAARALGISRQALYLKLERFGLADD